jgi:DNA polymerase V
LPCPVDDDLSLIKATTKAFESIFKLGFAYHKAGVMVFDLLPRDQQVQLDLFFMLPMLPMEDPKSIQLTQAVDCVNTQFVRVNLYRAHHEYQDLRLIRNAKNNPQSRRL